jgi:hypothetical protein
VGACPRRRAVDQSPAGFEVPPPRVEEPVAAPVLAAALVEDEV